MFVAIHIQLQIELTQIATFDSSMQKTRLLHKKMIKQCGLVAVSVFFFFALLLIPSVTQVWCMFILLLCVSLCDFV